jgi:Holliday junction resolvase RusA-like endonuclease
VSDALFEVPAGPPPVTRGVALAFEVLGTPKQQGSKRAFINKHTGFAGMKDDNETETNRWRDDVVHAAREEMPDGWVALEGPLRVTEIFRFARPKYHYRTGRFSHLLRDDAPIYHSVAPDLDKLLRSTGDALTTVGVYRDDCQISDFGNSKKVYCAPGELPGAAIIVRPLP